MKKLFIFLVVMALSIPLSLFGGLIISDFWRWFIMPALHAPAITQMQAIGLSYFVSFFKIGLAPQDYDKGDEWWGVGRSMTLMIAVYPLFWGMGWVWHQFIH